MATELHVRIRPNPYQGHEAVFWWNGMLNRYSFDSNDELAYQLVRDKIHPEIRDEVIGAVENYEWERTFPLGVVWVGEAVCDSPLDGTVYPPGTMGYEMYRHLEPTPLWDWFASTLRIGAVVAPWVILLILGRVAWAKAVAWGWV